MLRQEFRTPGSYFPILKAIAQGARKFGEISSKTGYDKSNLTKYLASLEKLRLIRREVPANEPKPSKSRKGMYFIRDNFVHFWFNFVFPYLSDLESDETDRVMKESVLPKYDHYVSQNVEPIIRDLLKRDYFNLGIKFRALSRYWDKNTEIDIWGETDDNRIVVGEIKWTQAPCKKNVYFDLINKISTLHFNKDVIYILISKSGFVKSLKALQDETLILIDLREWQLNPGGD
jgi:AAA+ ATPase superfamily predicted ATPase